MVVAHSTTSDEVTKSLKSGAVWVYLSLVFQAVVKFLTVVLLTRLLDPSDFGLVGIALIFTSVAERFGSVGVAPSVVQRAVLSADERRTAEVLSVLSGGFIAIILAAGAPFIGAFFNQPRVEPVLQLLALGFLFDGFGVVPEAMMQRHLQFRLLMTIENVSFIFGQAVVGIVMAFSGCGVWALVGANLSLRAMKLTGLLLHVPRDPVAGRFRLASARMLLDTGFGFSLGRILNFLSLQGDNFVVGRLLGAEALGMYTRAYQLMALPAMFVGQVFDRIFFPALAKQQDNTQRVKQTWLSSVELVTLISLPTAVGMFLSARDIIIVLFGERWIAVIPVLSILSLGVFFRTTYKCSDTLVKSLGAVYQHAFRQAFYTTVVLGGSVVGGMVAGLEGVAWAVVAAVAIHYLVITELAVSMLKVSWLEVGKAHLPGFWMAAWIAVALCVLNVYPALSADEVPAVLRLVIKVVVAGSVALGVYGTSCRAFRGDALPKLLGLLLRPKSTCVVAK